MDYECNVRHYCLEQNFQFNQGLFGHNDYVKRLGIAHFNILLTATKLWLLGLACILFMSFSASATKPFFLFNNVGFEQGLSNTVLSDITQDPYGYIWIATQSGLFRYDGYDFKVFKNNSDDATSIPDSYVNDLFIDKAGALWIGTDVGLAKYNYEKQTFTRYLHDENNPSSLSNNIILSIVEDEHNALWVGTLGGGLNRLNRNDNTFSHFRHTDSDPTSLSHDSIFELMIDSSGAIWVGTHNGLNKMDSKKGTFTRYFYSSNKSDSLSNSTVYSLHEDNEGDLWVGTRNGLNLFDRQNKTFSRYLDDDETGLGSFAIKSIFTDNAGSLWVGSEGGGLILFDKTKRDFVHYLNDPLDETSIGNDNITSIIQDKNGLIWLASNAGISSFDPTSTRFGLVLNDANNPNSLNNNDVYAIMQDNAGILWIGTNAGVNRYDSTTDKFKHYQHNPDDANSISSDDITSLFSDDSGNLWVGTRDGLNLLPAKQNQFVRFYHDKDDDNSLSNSFINSIRQDHEGSIWVATRYGLNRYDYLSKKFTRFVHHKDSATSISHNEILSLLVSSDGTLWVGTMGGGLNRYDHKTQTFTHYKHDPNNANSLSHDWIYSMAENSKGVIWLATNSGLNSFEPDSNRFDHFRKKDGLSSDSVSGVLVDSDNKLWLVGDDLTLFDPTTGSIKTGIGIEVGCNGGQEAFFRANDGKLFFGGYGYCGFYAEQIFQSSNPPDIVFTDFRLLNKSVPVSKKTLSSPLTKDINLTQKITLTHKDNVLSFEFAALHFTDPTRNQYKYQLQGFDENWIETGPDNRRATYTNLPDNEYTFVVKASNYAGVWNEKGRAIKLTVLPPFWRTWWAYFVYILLVISALFTFVRSQKLKVARARLRIKQEQEINQRLKKVDKLKDDFLANTSHELRTPLNGIIGLAESLIDGARGPLTSEARHDLGMVVNSGKRLSHLVNDILDFSKLKLKELPLNLKPIDLHSAVEVTVTMATTLLKKKPIELCNNIATDLEPVFADENRLQQILFNLVGNAIKFTESGSIKILAVCTDSMITVSVVDTGIGISLENQKKIFESFEQVDSSNSRQYGGTGLGLTVTRQLVELHKGTIQVSSNEGQGSEFKFTLPVSDKPLSDETSDDMTIKPFNDIADNENVIVGQNDDKKQQPEDCIHVLVVDDEPINQQVLTNHLTGVNYKVTTALDGDQALESISNTRFDLILLDIMMPKMTGYEVARKIREKFLANQLPIIMLTAKNRVSDLVEGFSSGTNDYLAKPFSKKELLARISTQLNLLKINSAYARFVPSEFLKTLGHDSILDVRLGDQIQQEMTILFLDIREFTSMSEKMTPKENFDFLNEYLHFVIPSIRENNGFIDKYIGDAVMALFPRSSDDAVKAGIDILVQIRKYNLQREAKQQDLISIGIGLHTGSTMLGTIGDEKRMDGTVIADAVNLAARLEGLTKLYGASLVVSEQSFAELSTEFQANHRPLGKIQVKGKQEAVSVYEIFDGDGKAMIELKKKSMESYNKAFSHYYAKEFEEAAYLFKQVLKINPEDKTAALYRNRSAKYMVEGVDDEWNGTEKMDSK